MEPATAAHRAKNQPKDLRSKSCEFVAKLIDAGVFRRVDDSTGVAVAWTGPMFASLDFDQKTTAASLTHACEYGTDPNSSRVLLIRDGMTGKDAGAFSRWRGLALE
jgi:hypothetical protein